MAPVCGNISSITCKICGSHSHFIFSKTFLTKYEVSFFQCDQCGFVQTEKPYWLSETYRSLLFAMDTGLISRPLIYSQLTDDVIMKYFNPKGIFIDYGGSNGVFVRLMRDRGFGFYRQDKYAANIYALFFDVSDLPEDERHFELLTCFEVLEHFVEPLEEFNELFSYSKNILCSTIIQPSSNSKDLQTWWYLGELHGQHVSFYTEKSLRIIAERFGCFYYTNNVDLHLFTPNKLKGFAFQNDKTHGRIYKTSRFLLNVYDRASDLLFAKTKKQHPESLTLKDSDWIIQQIKKGKMPSAN